MNDRNQPAGPHLGANSVYPQRYDPNLLHAIERAPARADFGSLEFHGEDLWNAWELSWLDERGKPVVSGGRFRIPADSQALIESKSLKLYLNSLNQTRFTGVAEVQALLDRDLSDAAGAQVTVELFPLAQQSAPSEWQGNSLDELELDEAAYHPAPELLRTLSDTVSEQRWYSHLFRSLCPVTGQPDWGSVAIRCIGPQLDSRALLAYIVSFRLHSGFHEQCVEQIYADIWSRCAPLELEVHARFLRRGGLDINPCRGSIPVSAAPGLSWRQ